MRSEGPRLGFLTCFMEGGDEAVECRHDPRQVVCNVGDG
jgi:hypothetical protein